ncbi:MAG: type IX secretion system membrane protein PorP/SprF [Bacteroidota bacterium]
MTTKALLSVFKNSFQRFQITIFIFLAVILCFSQKAYSQQDPQYKMYWNNYSTFNPAATGIFAKHYAAINGRKQWIDFPGAPQSANCIYDLRIDSLHNSLGVNYTYYKVGIETNNQTNLNYSFRFNFKNDRALNVGIGAGIYSKMIDFSLLSPYAIYDPFIPTGRRGPETQFNLNFGVMYKTSHWLIGLSSTHLTEPSFKEIGYQVARHYYFVSSCKINVSKSLEIKPGILIKTDLSAGQIDANLLFTYKKWLWIGATYRPSDAVAFMGGIELKQRYRLGYSYDYTTSKLRNYSHGSHEIILAFIL